MRRTTRRRCGLHVAQTVAHKWYVFHINAKAIGHLLNQSWQGLSACACIFRRVRAVKNRIDSPTHGRQRLDHVGMHGVERGLRNGTLDRAYSQRTHALVNTRIGYVAAMDEIVGDLAATERKAVRRLVALQVVGALLLLGLTTLATAFLARKNTALREARVHAQALVRVRARVHEAVDGRTAASV